MLSKTWYEIYDDNSKVPKALNRNGAGHVFYDNQKSMLDKVKIVYFFFNIKFPYYLD